MREGERAEDGECHDDGRHRHVPRAQPEAAGLAAPGERPNTAREEDGPRQAGEVGVAIGRDLGAGLHEPEHGRDDDGVADPRREETRRAVTEQDEAGRQPHHAEDRENVPRPHGIQLELEQVERGEPHRHERLSEVEPESVGGLRHARDHPVLGECTHRLDRRLCPEGEDGEGEGDEPIRSLLEQHASTQDHGQRDPPRLRQEGEDEAPERDGEPPPPRSVLHPKVGEHGDQVEEAREDVAPLGRPGDRLDPQRVDGEEERPHRGRRRHPGAARRQPPEKRRDHEVERDRVRRVQKQVGEMVPGRIHAPDDVVEAERHPAERLVVAAVHGRQHPAQVAP